MFERFTERGRQAVVEAQEEARRQRHPAVYPEHLLAGLILESEGMAAVVLEGGGWTLEGVQETLRRKYVSLEDGPSGQIPFEASTAKALELSLREALSLGHNYVGTEHILLGLCRLNEVFLVEQAESLREATIRLLSGTRARPSIRPVRATWERVVTPPRCHAGFSLYGANFHCQSDLGHPTADGHVEYGDDWTVRWDS